MSGGSKTVQRDLYPTFFHFDDVMSPTCKECTPMSEQDLRFYPADYPSFDHEPTRDRFEIVQFEDGQGEGLISKTVFQPGQIVFAFTGDLLREITQYTLQVSPGLHIHDPYVMGKVLHCCDPNTHCDMERLVFTAVKPIYPGECITMDYDQTEEVLFRAFECCCGAPNCRGMIRGSSFREDLVLPENVIELLPDRGDWTSRETQPTRGGIMMRPLR